MKSSMKELSFLFSAMCGCLTRSLWLIATIAILLLFCALLYRCTTSKHPNSYRQSIQIAPSKKVYHHTVFKKARDAADIAAEKLLSDWIDQIQRDIDEKYLPWHFSYLNQQSMQLRQAYFATAGLVTDTPASEKMIEYLQREFESRVLSPETAQLKYRNITAQVISVFFAELTNQLTMQLEYSVPTAEWQQYLDSTAQISSRIQGLRNVPLPMKAATSFGAIKAGQMICRSSLMAKLGFSAVTKGTATTLSKVSLWTTAATLLWECWDHAHTVSVNKPLLRESLSKYLDQVKTELHGEIMKTVTDIEMQVSQSIE